MYTENMNRYGVPLDSRADYTKIDWLMWVTKLCDDKVFFDKVCRCIVDMINETTKWVPMCDWYFTTYGEYRNSIN